MKKATDYLIYMNEACVVGSPKENNEILKKENKKVCEIFYIALRENA